MQLAPSVLVLRLSPLSFSYTHRVPSALPASGLERPLLVPLLSLCIVGQVPLEEVQKAVAMADAALKAKTRAAERKASGLRPQSRIQPRPGEAVT